MTTSAQHGFDLNYLYNFTHQLNALHEYIVRPYTNSNILALTFKGCIEAVGSEANHYSRQDVYDRVLLWRLPLIALWATTTLPPFAVHSQVFTLMQLIADPIDTTWSLLYKLDLAKRTTRWAQKNDSSPSSFVFPSEITATAHVERVVQTTVREVDATAEITTEVNDMLREEDSAMCELFHDVPAVIITAYDEWGCGEQAARALSFGFNAHRWSATKRTELRNKCVEAAFFIASDRVSRLLPSAASGVAFIVQIFASFWKALGSVGETYDESNPASTGLNRVPHNIAFGALFFWLPFVVLMTAFIGGSQTSQMIPKVLENLRKDFVVSHASHQSTASQLSLDRLECETLPDLSSRMDKRWSSGGLPVWQMDKFKDFDEPVVGSPDHRPFAWMALLLSFSIVAIPTGCAMAISWLTPTEGFGCRAVTQLSILTMWCTSAAVSWGLFAWNRPCSVPHRSVDDNLTADSSRYSHVYWIIFAKNFLFMSGTIGVLTGSAVGMFNKCECWCKWPSASGYISFPQDDFIYEMIKHRLRKLFPTLVGCALISQIVIFGFIWWQFREGYRVLKQRDIESVLQLRDSSRRGQSGRTFGESQQWIPLK